MNATTANNKTVSVYSGEPLISDREAEEMIRRALGSPPPPSDPDWMEKDLAKSGITMERATQLGFRKVSNKECAEIVGFGNSQWSEGYAITFTNPVTGKPEIYKDKNGNEKPFVRVRLEKPAMLPSGRGGLKPAKYIQAINAPVKAYILDGVHKRLMEDSSSVVYLTEGEKKVIYAFDKYQMAVIGLCGIYMWISGKGEPFLLDSLKPYATAGRTFVMIFDSDGSDPGKIKIFMQCARRFAGALAGFGVKLHVVFLPPVLPNGKTGLDDYLMSEEGTPEKLQEHIRLTSPHPVNPDMRKITSAINGQTGGRPRAEYAEIADGFITENHRRKEDGLVLLRRYRQDWYRFSGQRWRVMPDADLDSQVMAFLRTKHPDNANKNTLVNVIANLKASDLCGVESTPKLPFWLLPGFPAAPGWMAMSNCLVNVRKVAEHITAPGTVRPEDMIREHDPKLFSTFAMDYPYEPDKQCPMWMKYLEGVQPNPDDRVVIQKMIGLLLVPISYNVAFFLYGEGGTGKTVCTHVVVALVGKENICCVPLASFEQRFSLHPLTTSLVNFVGDLSTENENMSLSNIEGTFRDVCDGGLVRIERKFKDSEEGYVTARCLFAMNKLPHFADRTNAIWDRLRIIRFDQRFRGSAQENRNLRFELVEKELPGIFNWAIEGLALLLRDNPHVFPEHSAGTEEKQRLRESCDPEMVFFTETCVTAKGQYVDSKKLYDAYREWMLANGHRGIKNSSKFINEVQRIFPRAYHRRSVSNGLKRSVFDGIRMATDTDRTEDSI